MSFSTEIKQEIALVKLDKCCAKAQLSALIQLTSSLSITNRQLQLLVRSENPTTAKRVVALIKELYPIKTELEVARKTNLKKNNVYTVSIISDAKTILEDLGLYSSKGLLNHPTHTIVAKDCCTKSYLAGCFLAYGSCNSPLKTNYHLEIAVGEEEHASFILKLINRFIPGARISKRRSKYIVYIKRADIIADFLKLIGASESVMKYEDVRISRDIKNSYVRLDNCEIANEVKTLAAAKKQLESIQKIKESGKYETLPEKIKNVIDLRTDMQEASLLEMCDAYQKKYGDVLSKSGLKHRLNKIEDIASRISEEII